MRWIILLALICGAATYKLDFEPPPIPAFKLPATKVCTDPASLRNMAHIAAIMHDIPPKLLIAQVQAESNFNHKAISPAGARGIAQIMPSTAKAWRVDPDDPLAALDKMAEKMAGYWRTYQKQGLDKREAWKKALVAYNCGPYCANPNNEETRHYISRVMREAKF